VSSPSRLAALAGLEVTATAGPANQGFVRGLGAARTVDYHRDDDADAFDGVTHLLDLVGPGTIDAYQDRLAPGARVVAVVGLPERLRPDLWAQAVRALPSGDNLAELARLVGSGQLRIEVQETFALEQIAAAHRLLEGGHVRGKLVIDLRDR
jgi:NADPH:quinone reductase-like Zn-dependent oxidoreductase